MQPVYGRARACVPKRPQVLERSSSAIRNRLRERKRKAIAPVKFCESDVDSVSDARSLLVRLNRKKLARGGSFRDKLFSKSPLEFPN